MEFQSTKIKGIYIIKLNILKDIRGSFIKTFNKEEYGKFKIKINIREAFYTTSCKNVIRGMHFQKPPKDQAKIVSVIKGKITDVMLDIRGKSLTFGQYLHIQLSSGGDKAIYMPPGIAHGFASRENRTIVSYLVSKEYSPNHDTGIKWDSFGYDWKVKSPTISGRDKDFPDFFNFKTPFKY